jgi:hypothetical protein
VPANHSRWEETAAYGGVSERQRDTASRPLASGDFRFGFLIALLFFIILVKVEVIEVDMEARRKCVEGNLVVFGTRATVYRHILLQLVSKNRVCQLRRCRVSTPGTAAITFGVVAAEKMVENMAWFCQKTCG